MKETHAPDFRPTLGVVGGMGPLATAEFLRRVIEFTPADRDQAHIHVIVDCNPTIPDRTAALLGRGPEPGSAIAATARNVFAAGAGVIAMPCMTAHAWLASVRAAVPCPVLDMAEGVAAATASIGYQTVGVLATEGTTISNLLGSAFDRAEPSPKVVLPNSSEQKEISSVIERIKMGDFGVSGATINHIARRLMEHCDAVVLACTELSLLRDRLDSQLPWIDAMDLLAEASVEACVGALPESRLRVITGGGT